MKLLKKNQLYLKALVKNDLNGISEFKKLQYNVS